MNILDEAYTRGKTGSLGERDNAIKADLVAYFREIADKLEKSTTYEGIVNSFDEMEPGLVLLEQKHSNGNTESNTSGN